MTETNSIQQESIDYISNNINAQTSEIPKHLLEYWLVPMHISNYWSNPQSLSSYLSFQHALEIHNRTLGKELELSPIEKIALFEQFQLIIRTALGKENVIKINHVNLFDFDNYSKLNITVL